MDQQKDPKDPSSTSVAYDVMKPRWDEVETLLGGTEAMRAAGEKYLPRHDKETDAGYNNRLRSAVLLNMVEKTLGTLVGKPFAEGLTIGEDVPAAIQELLDDVDLQGNSADVFCRGWFREGLAKAFCHVLVEFPQKPDEVKTKEDERKANLRPYWVLIKPECLIFASYEVINGRETPVHVRILESYKEMNGFIEEQKQRIRILEPGKFTLMYPEKGKDGKVTWVEGNNPGDEGTTGLPYIPLVTFYSTKKDDTLVAKSKLQDLVALNITHWQSSSDQRNILTISRFPLLACSGASKEDSKDGNGGDITIGPNKILYVDDPQGEYYYVEHTGAAIEAGRNDLKDLEEQMANYGAEFLKEKPGNETATAAAIDSAEATSDLKAICLMFCDTVAQALAITAEWLGLGENGGTVSLVTDWSDTLNSVEDLATIKEARKNRDLSRKAYLTALKEREILPEDFDPEVDAKELDKEFIVVPAQDLAVLQALKMGNDISFTELRDYLRRARVATQTDEAAKEEMDSEEPRPGPGVLGARGFGGAPTEEEEAPPGEKTPATEKPPIEES